MHLPYFSQLCAPLLFTFTEVRKWEYYLLPAGVPVKKIFIIKDLYLEDVSLFHSSVQ
jgi:hypothetical protein